MKKIIFGEKKLQTQHICHRTKNDEYGRMLRTSNSINIKYLNYFSGRRSAGNGIMLFRVL